MFILSFYVFMLIYIYLFGLLFQLDFNSFDKPLFYVLGIITLLLSWFISFLTQLFFIYLWGKIREKDADPFNMLNHRFGIALLQLGAHLLGIKTIVTGKENIPKGNFVLIGNHQENYDIIILKPIFKNHPINFIAKEALFKTPIIGRWIGLLGSVPISKYADRSAAESIVKAIKKVKLGIPFGIFPEGKRSFSNEMIDFKPGAFKLAMKPKADILIVTLYDISSVNLIPYLPNKTYVHFHPVLPYEEYKDLSSQELSNKVKNIIQERLNQFKEDLGH